MSPPPQSSRSQVRILIVEDHVLFAESLDLALSVEGYDVRRVDVPEDGSNPASLVTTLLRLRPRIVLLDLDLGAFGDGVRLISPLAKAGANVVVVTASSDRGRWGEALRHGARATLSKSQPLNDILGTVRRINAGLPVMGHEQREELLRVWHEQRRETQGIQERFAQLTARETQVLGHLMLGHTVHDIAAAGVVSEATVRTQVKSILSKLRVSSQLAAVGLAHQIGWRPPPL
ncbi:DNA-binding response regulator, NarL/FixJ family, contains REC and HTH domains [Nocardioides terrae]|uniref:DNA-binding response regulator, NarL/FixJ family, contains REC and HTH domains n=1 Tax=Nocardioides terrae TaxID=574651 RepID=A0A1I1HV41_9ACTN|nr:response regulator transcription factor [Nocardioides terrae]SFC27766.1 DNA-binding response regulator, NarL/FixJ family, contains REC and HTH domains [Nocardioides terrae]